MKIRDLLERCIWTVVAASLTNLGALAVLDLALLEALLLAGVNGFVTYLLVIARWRLSVLPDPGQGLPGLPAGDRGNSTVDLVIKVLLIVLLAVVVLAITGVIEPRG